MYPRIIKLRIQLLTKFASIDNDNLLEGGGDHVELDGDTDEEPLLLTSGQLPRVPGAGL